MRSTDRLVEPAQARTGGGHSIAPDTAAAPAVNRPRFRGRVCLVTGGSRGIGEAVSRGLVHEGAIVGVVSRSSEACHAVATSLGDAAIALPADVSDPSACAGAVARLTKEFGPPDVLVNAAGISPVRQRAEKHDVAAFDQILRVNVIGAYSMAQAVVGQMVARGGTIVMIASAVGLQSSPRLAGYGASKAALIQLTRTLAREWGNYGIRVNAVCPGYVETAMTSELLAREHLRQEIVASTAIGRIGTIDDVVGPVLFLASDEAAYITGAILAIDGGMSA